MTDREACPVDDAPLLVLEQDESPQRLRPTRRRSIAAWSGGIVPNMRRLAVLLIGLAFIGAGLIMLVLPGPGLLVSIAGLALLATEFAWAERMLYRTRARANLAISTLNAARRGRVLLVTSSLAMLTGGAAVLALVEGQRLIGASACIAGLCALAARLPHTQRLLDAGASSDTTTPSKGTPS